MTNNIAVIVCLSASACIAADNGATAAVQGGAASFVANTTVPGVSVKGKSTALEARAVVQHQGEGLRLQDVAATVPVKSILTGMAIRDEHMRRYIFTAPDGTTPDLRFETPDALCTPQSGHAGEFSCKLSGTLAIRGVARPFVIPLKLRAEGQAFRAAGDATVKLSDYGIEQPSQFGVKTANEIQVHLDFTAKEAAATLASGGAR
uniref:Lipid/polyisoprenoid-binding YceI-like domain-containing protein n=1 Tax=Solibacter usitatus (strain Ellin6076) TaxID=234267 RepID=Q01ZW2_SOLUE